MGIFWLKCFCSHVFIVVIDLNFAAIPVNCKNENIANLKKKRKEME
jgi:hypothetical protein